MNSFLTVPRTGEHSEQTGSDAVLALAATIRERGNAFIIEALNRHGIDDLLPAHGAVLHALFASGPLRMQDIALRIGKKKNTVTGLINTLEARGYCRRKTDACDGRAQLVALTDKGQGSQHIVEEISRELQHKIWQGVSPEARRACTATLARILRNLEENAGE